MLKLVLWSSMLALTPLALLALGVAWNLIARVGDWMDASSPDSLFEIEPRRPLGSLKHDPLSSSGRMTGRTPYPRHS
jgi:hypothetical protein